MLEKEMNLSSKPGGRFIFTKRRENKSVPSGYSRKIR
jgi:hypothetical protein